MLIGLHGKKQAGKDTVYERVVHLLGPGSKCGAKVERVSFADLLYKSAAFALGVEVDVLRQWKSHPTAFVELRVVGDRSAEWIESTATVRQYLQRYGTEAHRELFGSNFWVDHVDLTDHEGKIVLVTDVRFSNEAQAVADAGGSIVHVVGPGHVEDAGDGHASEETLPGWLIDYVLPNTSRDDGFASLDEQVLKLTLALLREGKR